MKISFHSKLNFPVKFSLPRTPLAFLLALSLLLTACTAVKEPVWLATGVGPAAGQVETEIPQPADGVSGPTAPAPLVTLKDVHLEVQEIVPDPAFPPGCTEQPPACLKARPGYRFLAIKLVPRDLPAGQMLPYKELPEGVAVIDSSGAQTPSSAYRYDNATQALTLAFEVPVDAAGFRFLWPGADIPLSIGE